MIKKNKTLYIMILIFAAAFIWALFFTYGMPFFWEDIVWHFDYPLEIEGSGKLQSTGILLKDFVKEFISPARLLRVAYDGTFYARPYSYLVYKLLLVIFEHNVLMHRIFKGIVFAISALLIYLIIGRVSKLFALIGVLLYISSAEIWIALCYLCVVGFYSQCAMIAAVLLFLKLLDKSGADRKTIWLYYGLIILLTQFANLMEGSARYSAVIFLLTVLFFRKKELKYHLLPLIVLLFFQIPVLGFIARIFTGVPEYPIDIWRHNPLNEGNPTPLIELIKTGMSNFKYPLLALGWISFILISFLLCAYIIYIILSKKGFISTDKVYSNYVLNEKTFLSFTWFAAAFFMVMLSRSFMYDGPHNWCFYECSYFIAPWIIFVCIFAASVGGVMKRYLKAVTLGLCMMLLLSQSALNLVRLNQFRGGWGNYFCAWDNTRKYINEQSNNAVVFTATEMCYRPFVFRNSNNEIMNNKAGSDDLAFIEKVFEERGCDDIFLAERFGVRFKGKSEKVILKNTTVIDGNTGDLYDHLKLMIGRGSRPVIHVYHFIYKAE